MNSDDKKCIYGRTNSNRLKIGLLILSIHNPTRSEEVNINEM